MSFRFRRVSARLAVGLIAAALPLVAASAAQAALGGAGRLVTTNRPDLVSATITGANSAQFCFDKPVTAIADIGGFYLGGYRADAVESSTAATASGNCVNALVSTSPDLTYAQVGEGAVRTTGNIGNRADSVALTGSNTGNGTRAFTVAPDLTGISVVAGATQQIAFTYDEPVSSTAIVGAGGFHFVTSGGQPNCSPAVVACDISSQTATISATDPDTVIVQFPVGGVPLVTAAVRAYSLPGAVISATDGLPDGFDSAANVGSSGVVTGVPAMLSAQYSRQPGVAAGALFLGSPACGTVGSVNCVVVDYTFNEGVSVNNIPTTLANFYAYLSDGSYVNPTALTEPSGTTVIPGVYTGSTTVRAYFTAPAATDFDEYLVKAGVNGAQTTANVTAATFTPLAGCSLPLVLAQCAVVSTTTGHPNTPSSEAVGGNTGGKSTGFTTAPDALNASFDTQTNTASVTFDSRDYAPAGTPVGILAVAPAIAPPFATTSTAEALNFQLVNSAGNDIAGATGAFLCSPSTPGFPTAAGCAIPTTPVITGGVPNVGPGPETVYLTYPSPAVQVGNAIGIEIRGRIGGAIPFGFAAIGGNVFNLTAVTAPNGQKSSGNLQQIVMPLVVAGHTHWSHIRMTKTRLAKTLAKTKHHNKRNHR